MPFHGITKSLPRCLFALSLLYTASSLEAMESLADRLDKSEFSRFQTSEAEQWKSIQALVADLSEHAEKRLETMKDEPGPSYGLRLQIPTMLLACTDLDRLLREISNRDTLSQESLVSYQVATRTCASAVSAPGAELKPLVMSHGNDTFMAWQRLGQALPASKDLKETEGLIKRYQDDLRKRTGDFEASRTVSSSR